MSAKVRILSLTGVEGLKKIVLRGLQVLHPLGFFLEVCGEWNSDVHTYQQVHVTASLSTFTSACQCVSGNCQASSCAACDCPE